jgi:hypothetical protein
VHLIEQPSAQAAFDDACEKWQGAAIAWECATWVLLRDPNIGDPVTESGKTRSFTYQGARSIHQPSITLLYELRGDETIIHDAKFFEASYGSVGRA